MADKKEVPLPDGDGRYMIVNMVSRRARDINKQKMYTSMYDEDSPDPLDVAMNEYRNGLLSYEFRHHLTGTGDDYRSN